MEKIYELRDQLVDLNNSINENFEVLIKNITIAQSLGAQILPDWSASPSKGIPLEVIKNIDIYGPKCEEFVIEKENIEGILLKACSRKIDELLQQAIDLKLADFVIHILKSQTAQTLKINIIKAVEDLNNNIKNLTK